MTIQITANIIWSWVHLQLYWTMWKQRLLRFIITKRSQSWQNISMKITRIHDTTLMDDASKISQSPSLIVQKSSLNPLLDKWMQIDAPRQTSLNCKLQRSLIHQPNAKLLKTRAKSLNLCSSTHNLKLHGIALLKERTYTSCYTWLTWIYTVYQKNKKARNKSLLG